MTAADPMAFAWHTTSDHGADGHPYGSPTCNCDRIAQRARDLGWGPAAGLGRITRERLAHTLAEADNDHHLWARYLTLADAVLAAYPRQDGAS